MKIPAKVKVAGHIYTIEPCDDVWVDDSDKWGLCDRQKLVIKYFEGLPESRKVDTVLHEIMHALYYEYDLQSARSEEEFVTRLSTGLHQVFLDTDLRELLCSRSK